jgi:hypothetical protein
MAATWRYFAQRLGGPRAGEIIDPDLPLKDVTITDVLSGDNELEATIDPVYKRLMAEDGRPLMDEWGTGIFAEHQGNVIGGGIFLDSDFDGPSWSLSCAGYTSYLADLPYTAEKHFEETDVAEIFRHIWAHVQAQPDGNLDFEIDDLVTGILIGDKLRQVEFDTENGPLTFEAGPYKLAPHLTQDLSQNAVELAQIGHFDWLERHYWDDDEVLRHRLILRAPGIGTRSEARFVIGENVWEVPSVARAGEDYASDVLVLGAGDGSAQKRALSGHVSTGRLRRVAVVGDSSLRTTAKCADRAKTEVQGRNRLEDVSSIVVRDHPHARIGSINVGDEIYLEGDTGWIELGVWVRILKRSISPDESNAVTLEVRRTDALTA